MKMKPLGRTDVMVSEICLGSMTWGVQNTQAEGHAQIDFAVERGVNFIDTAELYAVPASAETYGATETIIGNWIATSSRRDQVVLATKVAGGGNDWIRDGRALTGDDVIAAAEGSLQRLKTDYIDLYQIHWPDRPHYHFRRSWSYNPSGHEPERIRDQIREILAAMQTLIDQGKIRHVGLSNETAWGTMQFLRIAEAEGLPRVVSTQNEYSLLHRIFDLDMAEVSQCEAVGLLAYSPLAAGILTGKYRNDATPAGSRRSLISGMNGRFNPRSVRAMEAYCSLAEQHGLDPAQMALAFCLSRPFMTSTIVGATSVAQLESDLGAIDITLSQEVLDGIFEIHQNNPIPM